MMAFDGPTSKTVELLKFCSNLGNTSDKHLKNNSDIYVNVYPHFDVNLLPWASINSKNECDIKYANFKQRFTFLKTIQFDRYFLDIPDMQGIFANGTNESKTFLAEESHKECFIISETVQTLKNSYITTYNLSVKIYDSKSFEEALYYAEQIQNLYPEFLPPSSVYVDLEKQFVQECSWTTDLANEVHKDVVAGINSIKNSKNALKKAANFANKLKDAINSQQKMIDSDLFDLFDLFDIIQAYTSGVISKLQLAERIVSKGFVKITQRLQFQNTEIQNLLQAYYHNLQISAQNNLFEGYLKLIQIHSPPLITRENVYDLEIVKATMTVNDTDIQNGLSQLKEDMSELLPVILYLFEKLEKPTEELKKDVINPVDDILERMETLYKNLEEYKDSTVMNSHFFM